MIRLVTEEKSQMLFGFAKVAGLLGPFGTD